MTVIDSVDFIAVFFQIYDIVQLQSDSRFIEELEFDFSFVLDLMLKRCIESVSRLMLQVQFLPSTKVALSCHSSL